MISSEAEVIIIPFFSILLNNSPPNTLSITTNIYLGVSTILYTLTIWSCLSCTMRFRWSLWDSKLLCIYCFLMTFIATSESSWSGKRPFEANTTPLAPSPMTSRLLHYIQLYILIYIYII